MIEDFENMLTNDFSKETLSIEIPKALNHLKAKDVKFETVKSKTLQPLSMIYSHNIVTRTIAYIFINTESRGLIYKNAKERGNMAIELFKGILEFHEVSFFHNL